MANANMFVVYTSSGGSNVTLSPRTTSSYQAPSHNGDAQVVLLEGSGVSNGVMTANVKCKCPRRRPPASALSRLVHMMRPC
jgi:hypothetical protein